MTIPLAHEHVHLDGWTKPGTRSSAQGWRESEERYKNTETFVPEAANSLHIAFLVVLKLIFPFLTKSFSSLDVNFRFVPDRGITAVLPRCLYLWTIVWKDAAGTSNCIEMVPRDMPDLRKATIHSHHGCILLTFLCLSVTCILLQVFPSPFTNSVDCRWQ